MQRKAIVVGMDTAGVDLLSLDEVEKSCNNAKPHCSTGCGCLVSGRRFRAALPKELSVAAGDTVEVSASSGQALTAAILIFGLPVAGGIGGWLVMTRLFGNAAEWISALGAFAGIMFMGVLIFIAGQTQKSKRLPEIIAVVNESATIGENTT